MARTKKSEIQGRYNLQLEGFRKLFFENEANPTEKKWRKSDDYKRIRRNKLQALRRYEKRTKNTKFLSSSKNLTPTNLDTIVTSAPYFQVLSYGSEQDKAAVDGFNLNKSLKRDYFFGVVDGTEIGYNEKPTKNNFIYNYQKAIQGLYKFSRKLQSGAEKSGQKGSYVMVSVVAADYDFGRILLTKAGIRTNI